MGGAWYTQFSEKKSEIEAYLKEENIAVLGVCEANISKEMTIYDIPGYVSDTRQRDGNDVRVVKNAVHNKNRPNV